MLDYLINPFLQIGSTHNNIRILDQPNAFRVARKRYQGELEEKIARWNDAWAAVQGEEKVAEEKRREAHNIARLALNVPAQSIDDIRRKAEMVAVLADVFTGESKVGEAPTISAHQLIADLDQVR